MDRNLAALKPALVWKHFAEIVRIPRPSGHEEKIRAYVMGVARSLGLECREDEAHNIYVRAGEAPRRDRTSRRSSRSRPYRHRHTCGLRPCRRASSRRRASTPRSWEATDSSRGKRVHPYRNHYFANSRRQRLRKAGHTGRRSGKPGAGTAERAPAAVRGPHPPTALRPGRNPPRQRFGTRIANPEHITKTQQSR